MVSQIARDAGRDRDKAPTTVAARKPSSPSLISQIYLRAPNGHGCARLPTADAQPFTVPERSSIFYNFTISNIEGQETQKWPWT